MPQAVVTEICPRLRIIGPVRLLAVSHGIVTAGRNCNRAVVIVALVVIARRGGVITGPAIIAIALGGDCAADHRTGDRAGNEAAATATATAITAVIAAPITAAATAEARAGSIAAVKLAAATTAASEATAAAAAAATAMTTTATNSAGLTAAHLGKAFRRCDHR